MRKRLTLAVVLCSALLAAIAVPAAQTVRAGGPITNRVACQAGFTTYHVRQDTGAIGYFDTTTASNWFIEAILDQLYDSGFNEWCPGMEAVGWYEIDSTAVPGVGYVCEVGTTVPYQNTTIKLLATTAHGGVLVNDCDDWHVATTSPEPFTTSGCFYAQALFPHNSYRATTQSFCQ